MAEYVIIPDKKEIPSSHILTEELHRRSLAVEIEVQETNHKWEHICFFDPANAETRCFVERHLHSLIYKVPLAAEPTHESVELQNTLVEIILHEVGGKVFDPETKKSCNLVEFRAQSGGIDLIAEFNNSSYFLPKSIRSLSSVQEMLWILFSWALVLLGFYFYRQAPQSRKLFMLAACGLALISAGGITLSSFQSNERG